MDRRPCEDVLEQKLGYVFSNPALLREALTHKSYSNEHPAQMLPHNERLEFLGDAVLDLVISDLIFRDYPAFSEGELTRIRAEVVQERGLALVARGLDLGAALLFGKGERRNGGGDKDSLLADALEALIGAISRDGGLQAVVPLVEGLFGEKVVEAAARKVSTDYKTRLQERLQAARLSPPEYVLISAEGPDHERVYTVEVRLDGRSLGRGRGRSKKLAEQQAAEAALEGLKDPG